MGGWQSPPAFPVSRRTTFFNSVRSAGWLAAFCLATGLGRPQETSPASPRHCLDPQTPQGLQELFRYTGELLPLVSAHRGGSLKDYPENSFAGFENTLRHTYAVMEVDPRYTKDGFIVIHHDPTLDRTTTGKGPVTNHTLAELKQFRLKDRDGRITEQQIPTLDELLEWARGKTILILDQKDVPPAARLKKIEEHRAEAYAMIMVYNFKDALACYTLNSNIMMEVMIPNRQKAAEFEQTGVPWHNLVAFVGHTPPKDPEVCAFLHQKGVLCLMGTSRNLDRQFLAQPDAGLQALERDYRAHLQAGVDLFETDIPAPLGAHLFKAVPPPPSKQKYFRRF